jgi:D-arabinose 1-dehydrogenase-like Zn-dependent alcohol dehydrogenase
MRPAPPVAVHCSGGTAWRALNVSLPALAVAAFAAWGVLQAGGVGLWAAAAALLSAAAVVAVMALSPVKPAAALQWDGQRWVADGEAATLQVMIDAGAGLLLRLHRGDGRVRWIAVAASEAGPAWHALRAAVYSRPPRTGLNVLSPERTPD